MNGRISKRLAELARELLKSDGGALSEGYNQYNQLENCISWEPVYQDGRPHDFNNLKKNEKRMRLTDPDGVALIGPVKKPGTIYTGWKYRMLYQNLKRLWQQTRGKHEVFSS